LFSTTQGLRSFADSWFWFEESRVKLRLPQTDFDLPKFMMQVDGRATF